VLRLVERLPLANQDDGLDLRSDLMMASILCGQGSDYTGAGMAIPLGHAIGARFNIDNGLADSIVLPHVIPFNASAAEAGLDKLAGVLGASRSG
jgi:alcohol dehydrogenase class IV